jgi:hypothetical protein
LNNKGRENDRAKGRKQLLSLVVKGKEGDRVNILKHKHARMTHVI